MDATTHSDGIDDLAAVAAIPMAMIEAWNRGDGDAFAARFGDGADFVAFEGTHLRGRDAIAEFHARLFATDLAGSRLEGEVRFARALDDDHAVVSAVAGTILPGEATRNPARESMQLFVAVRTDAGWRIEAVQNARQLTLERQYLLDRLGDLTPDQLQEVTELVTKLAG